MKAELEKHINQNLPFLKGKKLLIAVSGGIDSIVLTHLLYKLKFSISLAHCNFSLRGKESNGDEQFIIELGKKLNIPAFTIQFDTEKYAAKKGISTQMAARDLRYNWFEKICSENKLDYIITAHQKDDVIETFLINLTRGTGLDGLTGIPEVNKNIVRPLLPFSRNDLIIYATRKKLQWREDSSNSSIKYVRNKIRHKVVPFLKELNPNLLNSVNSTIENLKGSQQIVKDRVHNVLQKVSKTEGEEIHFNILALKKLSEPKVYLYQLLNTYGFTEWDDVSNLLDAQSGKQVYSKTHRLLKNRDSLILSKIEFPKEIENYQINENTKEINNPISLKFETHMIPFDTKNNQNKVLDQLIFDDVNTISIDANKIEYPLTIRKWKKGDYFYPIGLQGKKKLSKYFKDEKLSLLDKESTWVLCSNNDIVWVIGKRLDTRFKVEKNTSAILKIKS
ncbi:MAG: tRNA lysidine(34) synthetase TilS [Lutibacter sp.]|uniref:tRNA lysidine(34) synthetase TilS n=1 Tax=Lutibacter sp. TaxID=1925666 RepID=UPI0017E81797|nr:tRNA lysidine(34) synthetase TilS [Lutibacter sp.]MBT8317095.1 tRNA lysidine(34) synthetase TilS [Lutibacter sp.]NNJ57955.1 tRNA lysidine(34) synthetase TilS [Lutibacter sp.]